MEASGVAVDMCMVNPAAALRNPKARRENQAPTPDSDIRVEVWLPLSGWNRKVLPQSVVASHMTGGVADRTRPLCAYPTVARYIGSGSTDDARNFRCQTP